MLLLDSNGLHGETPSMLNFLIRMVTQSWMKMSLFLETPTEVCRHPTDFQMAQEKSTLTEVGGNNRADGAGEKQLVKLT